MSDDYYDQQPTRSSRLARVFGPPQPIEPNATVVAHAIAPPPWLRPPDYRRLTPGPPGYPPPVALPPLRMLALPPPPGFLHRTGQASARALGSEGAPGPAHSAERAVSADRQREPTPDPSDVDAESESEPKSYTVMVTLEWTRSVQPRSGTQNRALKEVKGADSKPIELDIANTTWPALIRAMLGAHRLQHKYSVSNSHGPTIKIHWKNSPGGAKLPCSIDDKEGWERVQALILKKNHESTPVYVSFHVDDLQRFRIRTRDEPDDGFDEDGDISRYKVARVGDLAQGSDIHVLHGRAIKDLETRWTCDIHSGEHGEAAHCYRPTRTSTCVQLNLRRKKIWAAAIHARRATLEVPPDISDFIPPQDPSALRLRRSAPAPAPASSGAEVGTLVSSIMAPFTASLVGAMSAMTRTPNTPAFPMLAAPTAASIQTQTSTLGYSIRTPSPIPNPTPETLISMCLQAFFEHTGLDLSSRKEYLVHNCLTPNYIEGVPFEHLVNKLGVPEGYVVQYREFCSEWTKKYKCVSRN